VNILIVCPFPVDPRFPRGGVEVHSYLLVKGLLRIPKVNKITVYDPLNYHSSKDAYKCNFLRRSKRFILCSIPKTRQRRSFSIINMFLIKRFCKLYKYNIVHFHGIAFWGVFYNGLKIFTAHGIPEVDVLYRHNYALGFFKSNLIKMIETFSRNSFLFIILVSLHCKRYFMRRPHIFFNISNPVDSGLLSEKRPRRILQRILCVSSMSRLKNISGLIEAFSNVDFSLYKNALLVIVGFKTDEAYVQRISQLIASTNLSKRILLLINLNRSQIFQEYLKASCFILPSFQESSPIVLREAAAIRLPILASNLPGNRLALRSYYNKYFFNPYSLHSITNSLSFFLRRGSLQASNAKLSRSSFLPFNEFIMARLVFKSYQFCLDYEKKI